MSINRKELNGLLLRRENINSLENTFAGIMLVETMCACVYELSIEKEDRR